jgi:hypothetical protein
VEPPRLLPLLRDLTERGKLAYLPTELAKLFREMDATYDSDLFAEHFSEGLDCEPGPFVALIKGLHEERTGYVQYNFNAIDADVLGTAYEQYLGHVIAGARAAEVVEKRAKRKSQGIYYTPTFVVRYIVRQTLGRYLDEHGYNPARPVRVLDMSCGSGSFLIEAFDTLDRHLARERSQAHGEREDVADYARRIEILSQNIYGVDKDEQAVAVAKLNLSLKALHARDKLPMLENIRVGDSLISGAPEELKAAFGKDWKEKKPFNWETEFREVFAPSPSQEGRSEGFDVIVGNPPYVRTESIPEVERDYFSRSDQFKCTYKKFDLYVLFLERAIHLLREGGRLGFIIPYPFLNQTYAEPLRRLILESACIESIVDLSGYKVFQDATVETCIIVLKKTSDRSLSKQNRINIISQGTYELGIQKSDKTAYEIQQSIFERTPQSKFRLDLRSNILPLIEKIEGQSIKLGQLYYVSKGIVAYSETDGRKKTDFLHTRRVNRRCVPYLEGKDVQRYAIDFKDQYLDYQPSVMARPTFRELHESPKLLVRAIAQGLLGSYDTERFYADQKLICCVQYRYLGTHRQVRPSDDLISDPRFDDGYVLGLVNSRLLNYYYRIILFGGLSILPEDVRCLPIRRINFDDPAEKQQHNALVALVDEMLQLQKDYAEAEREKEDRRHALKRRMDEVDAAIDRRVYNLYGLTEDEIKVVEAGMQ